MAKTSSSTPRREPSGTQESAPRDTGAPHINIIASDNVMSRSEVTEFFMSIPRCRLFDCRSLTVVARTPSCGKKIKSHLTKKGNIFISLSDDHIPNRRLIASNSSRNRAFSSSNSETRSRTPGTSSLVSALHPACRRLMSFRLEHLSS
jgi:hypothetical protein